ncbi:cell division protein FtsX [Sulfurimicrobium lacus]|uniref:Cell division protein FtsX n=1 Tax=Sulfurimicrobium lacus TaxID=2715678 RepID=A0A6F8V8V6_9PROT|nr:permease-like cell division protein FtsX [Sulfurimicrobium lacus]BCB25436.1 cell division protein FtsX [Sulfurimicrobium lacus]
MRRHWRTFSTVLRRFAATPLATLLTLSVIGIALSLPAGLYLLLSNLNHVAGNLDAEPQISLFLKRDAGKDVIRQIDARLKKHPGVKNHLFVGRDQALKDLSASSGLGDVTAGLTHNPLPDAYVVNAVENDPAMLEKLRAEAAGWSGVETAELDSSWARRLDALLGLGRQITLIVAALLGFGLIAGTGNTIRLQILTRLEEIEVSKLIGATDRFIRLPFLYHGALQGLLGGMAGWAIISASAYFLDSHIAQLAGLYGSAFHLELLGAGQTVVLLALSALLGWIGAYLAVSHFLRHFHLSHR